MPKGVMNNVDKGRKFLFFFLLSFIRLHALHSMLIDGTPSQERESERARAKRADKFAGKMDCHRYTYVHIFSIHNFSFLPIKHTNIEHFSPFTTLHHCLEYSRHSYRISTPEKCFLIQFISFSWNKSSINCVLRVTKKLIWLNYCRSIKILRIFSEESSRERGKTTELENNRQVKCYWE